MRSAVDNRRRCRLCAEAMIYVGDRVGSRVEVSLDVVVPPDARDIPARPPAGAGSFANVVPRVGTAARLAPMVTRLRRTVCVEAL